MRADPERALRAVAGYISDHGWAPSYREICEAAGIASTSGVRDVLMCLEQRGYIRLGSGARQIALTDKGREHAQA